MQDQQATGLLGKLFPNMTADRQDRLAVALSGLSMHPNQGVMQMAGQRMADRRADGKEAKAQAAEQQKINRTIQAMRQQGAPEYLIAAAEAGNVTGAFNEFLRMKGQQPEQPKPTDDMREYEYARSQGFQGSLQDWIISQRSAGATNINNNVGAGENAFQKKTGEMLATEAASVVEQGALAQRNLGQIGRLGELLSSVPEGANGAFVGMASNMGLKLDGASDVEAAQAIISQLVPQQRPPGSGVMSDADLELFKQSLPRLINTRDGNRMIVDTMRGIAEYDMKRGQIARALQLGQISQEQAAQAYIDLGNPLQNFKAPQVSQPAPTGSDADFLNLDIMSLTPEQLEQLYDQRVGGNR